MKKIININLSGRVIPIEDAAYESLQRYIESLRRYFVAEEGRDEIINDIESRIAELMNDKVRKGATAVTEADMDEIIGSMGRVEDFEATEGAETESTAGNSFAYAQATDKNGKQRFSGRLYRDSSDKMIGGVCAGISNYVNVDPAIIRLLFAIITFGGFGMGVFIYIVLWIVLPTRDLETYVGKRLFRNPEDRIIGGVAGGLGAYFNKKAWTIRLIFAAPLLLNILISVLNTIFSPWNQEYRPVDFAFGSLTGTFILAYIVLWIVLPEARSSFEKMEMRGEKVDVNRIAQTWQDRAQTWGDEVKTSAQQLGSRAKNFADTRGKAFASEIGATARPAARGVGHIIGILFKAFFLIVAGSIAFGLLVALIVVIFGGGVSLWPLKQGIFDFMIEGTAQKMFFWGTVILFFAVPIVGFVVWLVRRIMRVRTQRHYLGWSFAGLWTLGWISAALFAASLGRDFRFGKSVPQAVTIAQPPADRMIVQVTEPELQYSGEFWWIDENDNGNTGWDLTEDSLKLANVDILVVKSLDSNYGVTVWRYSRGGNRRDAEMKASNIQYAVSYVDSILNLGSGFAIGSNNKFRGQEITVEISVPVGKKLRFDESVTDRLRGTSVHVSEKRNWNSRNSGRNWGNIRGFDWQTGVDYIMTEGGDLERTDKPKEEAPEEESREEGVYEYKGANSDSLRRSIEEKERQLMEERQKLEQLEGNSTSVPAAPSAKPEPTTLGIMPLFPFLI